MIYRFSEIETRRFGIRCARADDIQAGDLRDLRDRIEADRIRLATARCATSAVDAAHGLETAGFRLMDTIVIYRAAGKILAPKTTPEAEAIRLRAAEPADADAVAAVAERAFAGYISHYHRDPHLDRSAADAAFIDWAGRSVREPGVADRVVVGEAASDVGQALLAFATLKRRDDGDGEGVLFGVAPAAAGQGLYGRLIHEARHWAEKAGCVGLVVSTQIDNLAVQKVWCRAGFVPVGSIYTFHGWFAGEP